MALISGYVGTTGFGAGLGAGAGVTAVGVGAGGAGGGLRSHAFFPQAQQFLSG